MNLKIKYEFTAKVWQYTAPVGWYFVSLPLELATKIRAHLKSEEEGWGRLNATAKIGSTQWETAIWFDTRHKTYLLPLKAEVRKKEKLETDKSITLCIWL